MRKWFAGLTVIALMGLGAVVATTGKADAAIRKECCVCCWDWCACGCAVEMECGACCNGECCP